MKKKHGTLVISLDFELYWGMRDSKSINKYRENIEGVWKAIPRLLEVFSEYDVHVTWAAVGLLFAKDKIEALRYSPSKKPSYFEKTLSPYEYIKGNSKVDDDKLYYAPELIRLISDYNGQEIATHTYSHYYCLEKGQSAVEFEADLCSAIRIAEKSNIEVSSLVFPRNQCNEEYLRILPNLGIKAFRGNEKSWLYSTDNSQDRKGISRRAARLLDTYINFSGHHTHDPKKLLCTAPPFDIPASRFLRPVNKRLSILETLRLRRIKKSMENAASKGKIFHLWFHPHNFGTCLEENINFLIKVLNEYTYLSKSYGMVSRNMGELAQEFLKEKNKNGKVEA